MDNPDLVDQPDPKRLLASSPFAKAGEAALLEVCQSVRVERLRAATLLSAAGTQPQYLRLVVQGHIEFIARSAAGDEFVVGFVTPGSWATWLSCFMDSAPDHDFCSSANAVFLAFPVEAVRGVCERHPSIYPHIIRLIGRRMRLLTEWTGQSVLTAPLQRLAKLLHLLAREQVGAADRVTLNVTQAKLAGLARCSRQTVNEMLQVLDGQGLVGLNYGRVTVMDLPALGVFAEAPPA